MALRDIFQGRRQEQSGPDFSDVDQQAAAELGISLATLYNKLGSD